MERTWINLAPLPPANNWRESCNGYIAPVTILPNAVKALLQQNEQNERTRKPYLVYSVYFSRHILSLAIGLIDCESTQLHKQVGSILRLAHTIRPVPGIALTTFNRLTTFFIAQLKAKYPMLVSMVGYDMHDLWYGYGIRSRSLYL